MRSLWVRQLTKLILGFLDTNKKVKSVNKVYFPAYFGVIGTIFSSLCGVMVFLGIRYKGPIIVYIIGSVFIALGFSLINVWRNKRIDFDENGFEYRSFWGTKRHYNYEQITSCWGDESYTLFMDDGRKISVDVAMCNSAEFYIFVNKRYNQLHGSGRIPKGKKKDIFNNNLKNPSDYIAVFVIICLCWSGMIGIGIYGYNDIKKMDESDCEYIASEVIGCRREENNLILTLKDVEEELHIDGFYDFAKNQEEFLALCDANKKFDAWCRYSDGEKSVDSAHYDVARISYNGTDFYSFEEFNRSRENSRLILQVIIVVCTLCLAGLMVLFLVVVRNPHKFSLKLVKSLIKPSELVGYEYGNKPNKNGGRKRKKRN